MIRFFTLLASVLLLCGNKLSAQTPTTPASPAVIAYYAGRLSQTDSFAVEKLTHIIFSFCHLNGKRISANNPTDTARIQRLVALKARNPDLKVLISLGGWGGCSTCSSVFSSGKGRRVFSRSVKKMMEYFHADGIDMDWEYPALKNYPGHAYTPEDKEHFTQLIRKLRKVLGPDAEISFAAGGFSNYLHTSVEWNKVMPLVNRVNLMSYDLVSGYDTVTGHHTPLYSTPGQTESTDHAVKYLDSIGVPKYKITIGAAFYARVWENVDSSNGGLYHTGHFRRGISFNRFSIDLSRDSGFIYHWDPLSQAPYMYNPAKKWFATFDDSLSVSIKTQYVLKNRLNGIMFWQLSEDNYQNGLLEAIDKAKKEYLFKEVNSQ